MYLLPVEALSLRQANEILFSVGRKATPPSSLELLLSDCPFVNNGVLASVLGTNGWNLAGLQQGVKLTIISMLKGLKEVYPTFIFYAKI